MKILLLEDNEMIIKALTILLKEHNYEVDVVKNIKSAKKRINDTYNLLILDLMLPDGDGFTFFRECVNIPTIVLSAKDLEDDVVSLLDAGADDYIIKPFRGKELLSRINKILNTNSIIIFENLVIDTKKMVVLSNNVEVDLTALELKILFFLIDNAGIIVSRELILEKIWDSSGKFVEDNTLTVYIKRIREKINNDNLIKTIKGLGYKVML